METVEIEHTYDWFRENADDFDLWFDSETFDWKWSRALARFCSKDFAVWWDAEKFNWDDSDSLVWWCSKDFDIWWDADRYDWIWGYLLILYCWDWKHVYGQDEEGRDVIFDHLRGNHDFLPIVRVRG